MNVRTDVARFVFTVFAVCFITICLAAFLPAMPAHADESSRLASGKTTLEQQAQVRLETSMFWSNKNLIYTAKISNFPTSGKLTEVSSSNPSVLKAERHGTKVGDCWLTALKPGKSTVTITYTVGAQTRKVSGVYVVKSWPSPFTSIKVNGKARNLPTSANEMTSDEVTSFSGTKTVVKFGMRKGWKIRNIAVNICSPGESVGKKMPVKNNKAFSVPKGKDARLHVEVVNKKNEVFYYGVNLLRSHGLTLGGETLWAGEGEKTPNWVTNTLDASRNAVVTKISSSNERAVSVRKSYQGKNGCYDVKISPGLPGKSKVVVTYQLHGKTYTTSAIYKVKSYPKPFKSILLNGVKINKNGNLFSYSDANYERSSAKVKLNLAKGWSIRSLSSYVSYYDEAGARLGSFVSHSGNSFTVKIPKGGHCSVNAKLVNKHNEEFSYNVSLLRGYQVEI